MKTQINGNHGELSVANHVAPAGVNPLAFANSVFEQRELRQSLPTEIAIISPCVEQLMCFVGRFRNEDGSELAIETALREALANAILHGNQQDVHKRVYVACRCTADGEVSITVEDEGSGFESDTIPDPTTPESWLLAHGRGIYLMRALMDEVRFEQGGTVVYMRKKPSAELSENPL